MTVKTHRLAFATATALAFLVGAAQAADLRHPAPAPMLEAAPVLPSLWSGFYLGGHAGYGWGHADGPVLAIPSTNANGALGGLQIGYNWQSNAWVYGLEGDFSWSGMDGDRSGPQLFGNGQNVFGVDVNWLSTVHAKLGYAPDRWLIYATGGIAFADVDVNLTTIYPPASDSNTHFGWTVGAGVEYALTDAWRLALDYKYIDLGSKNYSYDFPAPYVGYTRNVDLDVHAVTLRVNYRF
jgi:outer membrane immunogenic protein